MPTSPPPETEQVALRRALVELRPILIGRAVILCRGLRPPAPSAQDLVNTVAQKLLARYRDSEIQDARGLAFTSLGRLACDVARKYRFDAGVIDEPPDVAAPAADEPVDPRLAVVMATLAAHERCVLEKVVIADYAVAKAFVECKWESKSPHFEYKKLLKRVRAELEKGTPA